MKKVATKLKRRRTEKRRREKEGKGGEEIAEEREEGERLSGRKIHVASHYTWVFLTNLVLI